MNTEEYLDIVDDNDDIIGRQLRSEIYAQRLNNFRVVNAFVINSAGQLWIPRRSPSKRLFPLCLDMSMGGHVQSGENYVEAVERELLEELNVRLSDSVYRRLGKLSPMEHNVSAFMEVYEIKRDNVDQYNRNDFVEAFWLYPDEIIAKLNRGDKSKDDLPKLIRTFYEIV